jgi:O-antigen/teichoic acid export membrane protein
MIGSIVGRWRSLLGRNALRLDTEDGRARERQRRAILSSVAAVLGKVISVGTSLVTIPLTLNYLGTERFGLWMTISSIVAMLAFADLGIGNGLLNAIAAANGRDDSAAIAGHIASAAIILSSIAVVLLGAFCVAYSFIPWPRWFNVHGTLAVAEAGPAVFVFVICFALNVPATIVQRVQLGLQLGFVANLWQAAGSVMALAALLIAVENHASLPTLVCALAGMPVIAAFLNGAIFFGRYRPDLAPRIRFASRESCIYIVHTGVLFLILQVVVAVTYSSDNLIIAHFLGATQVTTYAIPEKLFSFISVMLSMILMPLWPAYGEALARGDEKWVLRIFKKSLLLSVSAAACAALILIVFGRTIINRWIGHSVDIPFLLMLGMGLWKIIEAAGNPIGILFNGANVVGFQVKVAVTTAVTAFFLKLYLVNRIGVSGPIYATVICYCLFALLPYSLVGRKIFRAQFV